MPFFQDPDTYRDVLDCLQVGVSVFDLQKKIVFWSDGAEQITGYTRIDVLGHSAAENILLHCNQNNCEMCVEKCPQANALHHARPVELLSFIRHKSGHRIPVHTWAIPLRNKHGSIIGIIQTFDAAAVARESQPNDHGIKHSVSLDDVTGLSNRAIMQSNLQESLDAFAGMHIPFSLVCLEVHELSQLRARYGQGAAALMLQVLARTLRNAVWITDFVGHWSENQFLVILCGCAEAALPSVAARMFKMMSRATIAWWGEELTIRVSVGCTAVTQGDNADSILERAMRALQPIDVAKTDSNSITTAAAASSAKGSSS